MKKHTFTAIIPVYNDRDGVYRCLNSLKKQTLEFDQIIVVDNGDDKVLQKELKKFPCEVAIELQRGRSFARNFGVRFAKSDYIVFLDSDVELRNDWLKNVSDYLTDRDVDYLGTKIVPSIKSGSSLDYLRQEKSKERLSENFTYDLNKKECSPLINTAASVVKKRVFIESKGFNETLSRNEDYEYSLRLCHYGYLLGFCSKAESTVYYNSEMVEWRRVYSYARRSFEVTKAPIFQESTYLERLKIIFKGFYFEKSIKISLLKVLFLLCSTMGILLSKESLISFRNVYFKGKFLREMKWIYEREDGFIYKMAGDYAFIFFDRKICIYQDFIQLTFLSEEDSLVLLKMLQQKRISKDDLHRPFVSLLFKA